MALIPGESLAEYNARMNAEANEAWARANPHVEKVLRGAMPHISQMFTSKYISRSDVETPVIATIRAVVPETVGGRMGQSADTKWIMYFYEAKKGLKLNSTMIRALADGFGEHTEGWIGQRVRLYVDPTVQFAGQTVGGVRVQCPRAAHAGALAGAAAPGAFTPAAGPAAAAAPPGAFGPQPGATPGQNGFTAPGGFAPAPGTGATFSPSTGELKAPGAARAPSPGDPEFDDDIPF
jgi:hypothetical protein